MKTDTGLEWRECRLGELFSQRKEAGKPGLPTLSVTMNDGIVKRDTMERKTNGDLAAESHLLIRKGDLAYNMMRMWQGASGLSEQDGNLSPAYVVIEPAGPVDPRFSSYWFKSARMVYLFWAYSYGITGDRLRLYYKDFSRIPVILPSLPAQVRIGRTLSALDRAIERTTELIASSRRLNRGIAHLLLTGEKRLSGELKTHARGDTPDGWTRSKLEKIATFKAGGTPSKDRADYWHGEIPWVTARDLKSHGLETTHLCITSTGAKAGSSIAPAGTIFILVRGMTLLKKVPVSVAAREMAFNQDIRAIVPNCDVNAEYVGRYLAFASPQLMRFVTIAGHGTGRLEADSLRAMQILLPPKEEQLAIAAVLRAADRRVELLSRKLSSLIRLKKGLMQTLMPGELPSEAE
jgi:type I restriction enzyme S subunit